MIAAWEASLARHRSHLWVALPLAALWLGISTSTLVPGVYMDAVNPDYLVAHVLGSQALPPPSWVPPGNYILGLFPLMTQTYHGALPFWVGLPFYAVLGTDVVGVRLTHGVYASIVVLAAWWMLTNMGSPKPLAAAVLAALAIDPAFQFIFRTQFYITTLPVAFLFTSIALAWPVLGASVVSRARLIVSGAAAGLSIFGYFHYAFYALAVGVTVWIMRRRADGVRSWVVGALIGVSPILLGWLLMTVTVGSLTTVLDLTSSYGGFDARTDPLARLLGAVELWALAFSGEGADYMMLGDTVALRLPVLKESVILWVPLAILALAEVTRRSSPALRLLAFLAIGCPMLYGLVLGSRLWVQHFTVVVPMVYCFAAIAFGHVIIGWRGSRALSYAVTGIMLALVAVNANAFREVVQRLEVTGGVALYSDAVNHLASDASADDALYVLPDWGLGMPLVMLTRGQVHMEPTFDTARIQEALCDGQDVVVASIGVDAEERSIGRSSAVTGMRPSSRVYAQRDGTPVIFALRWSAAGAPACPSPIELPAR
jgi:hypothetical protein